MLRGPATRVTVVALLVAGVGLAVADIGVGTANPWRELGRLADGLVSPRLLPLSTLAEAVLATVAFAVLGVAIGAVAGFFMAVGFAYRAIRAIAAVLRSVHELFWALMFMQPLGPSPAAGILAIAIPYAGIFAKVYAEILEEGDRRPLAVLPRGTGSFSAFLFARLPDRWAEIRAYTSYRFECGLRSSAVLGFIGLPTLGFHLESHFRQGFYGEAAGLLYVLIGLIVSLRLWARPWLLAPLAIAGLILVPGGEPVVWANVVRFVAHDIVPQPLRGADLSAIATWEAFGAWLQTLLAAQAIPGVVATVVVSVLALVLTGAIGLALFPLLAKRFFGPVGRSAGHVGLVTGRSIPEYVFAYVFLLLLGPSMLPAVLALALHNGAIVATLVGRHVDRVELRWDAPRGINLYAYEMVPRLYGQFLAFLFYRFEIIVRETAILGVLGVHTLGFYIDSAISELRIDRALVLLVVTAALNLAIDALSRRIRAYARSEAPLSTVAAATGRA